MVDDLSPFAAELIPEAFTRRHTAYRVHRVEPRWGEAGFQRFVDERLRYAVTYRCPCGVLPTRIVVVEDGDDVAWYWDDEGCCPPGWTVARVRREAYPVPEPWLFAIELLRPMEAPEPWQDGTGPIATLEGWPRRTDWTAVLYAEARGRGVATNRAEVVDLDHVPGLDADRIHLRTRIAVRALPTTEDFHRILYGHPARKQHPLRRVSGRRRS